VLKNALDNVSRPYGQTAWAGKPAGVISGSQIREALARGIIRDALMPIVSSQCTGMDFGWLLGLLVLMLVVWP
jgi:NAD(P)H-dependent FMN reductase